MSLDFSLPPPLSFFCPNPSLFPPAAGTRQKAEDPDPKGLLYTKPPPRQGSRILLSFREGLEFLADLTPSVPYIFSCPFAHAQPAPSSFPVKAATRPFHREGCGPTAPPRHRVFPNSTTDFAYNNAFRTPRWGQLVFFPLPPIRNFVQESKGLSQPSPTGKSLFSLPKSEFQRAEAPDLRVILRCHSPFSHQIVPPLLAGSCSPFFPKARAGTSVRRPR